MGEGSKTRTCKGKFNICDTRADVPIASMITSPRGGQGASVSLKGMVIPGEASW